MFKLLVVITEVLAVAFIFYALACFAVQDPIDFVLNNQAQVARMTGR